MLFNSLAFLIFFPIVTMLFFFLEHKYRWLMLLIASCMFYMYFKPIYILILAFTIIIDYYVGIWIYNEKEQKKKRQILILSLIANIGILVVFKYYNFLAENINIVAENLNNNKPIPLLNILLPIGLSFHTFQAMSYTIEVYRGNQQPEKHFGIYALYVMFYPQLVAGPIERPQNVLHQFHEKKYFNFESLKSGLRLIMWGLFKKCVIADRLAIVVDYSFENSGSLSGIAALLCMLFYAVQIYCDFSGYSDIAIGTARAMGFNLMQNFNFPFTATNVSEFWRKWHISLSTWFNDYLFIPIITAKRNWGNYAVAFGVLITFFISGLWHGAGWNFIIWGILHAIAVTYEFYTKKIRKKLFKKIPLTLAKALGITFTFCFLCFAWIFFRATSFQVSINFIKAIFTFKSGYFSLSENGNTGLPSTLLSLPLWKFSLSFLIIPSFFLLDYFVAKKKYFILYKKPLWIQNLFWYSTIVIILVFGVFDTNQFIYFQF